MNLSTPSTGKEAGLNLLLTSAGPTTEAIQEDLLDKARKSMKTGYSTLRVLRIADGWVPFGSDDQVKKVDRLSQRAESVAAKLWSSNYLRHVLPKHFTLTRAIGNVPEEHVANLLESIDLILVPGGNTWQTMRGIKPHQEALLSAIKAGTPYVSESAGTILAGTTLYPANLKPADPRPSQLGREYNSGLSLVDADVVVHAHGRAEDIAIPGPLARLASMALGSYETSVKGALQYFDQNERLGIPTYVLNDAEALTINGGEVLERI